MIIFKIPSQNKNALEVFYSFFCSGVKNQKASRNAATIIPVVPKIESDQFQSCAKLWGKVMIGYEESRDLDYPII